MDVVGAIEAGGTKFVCGVVTPDGKLLARTQFPTTTPKENYAQAVGFLSAEAGRVGALRAIGVGHFGPLVVDRDSPDYGALLSTPKTDWSGVHVPAEIARHTGVPVAIDTDVNCAALAEAQWGAGKGRDALVYVTVGTGIGAGILCDGKLLYGVAHPEVGHMFLPVAPEDEGFEGSCPFHGAHCAEGLASGPAILKRWGTPGSELPRDHPAWAIEAYYLATLCLNLALISSPARIILGGGVMERAFLYPMVRERLATQLNAYADRLAGGVDEFVVSPGLGKDAGVLGAAAIAAEALAELSG